MLLRYFQIKLNLIRWGYWTNLSFGLIEYIRNGDIARIQHIDNNIIDQIGSSMGLKILLISPCKLKQEEVIKHSHNQIKRITFPIQERLHHFP